MGIGVLMREICFSKNKCTRCTRCMHCPYAANFPLCMWYCANINYLQKHSIPGARCCFTAKKKKEKRKKRINFQLHALRKNEIGKKIVNFFLPPSPF